MAPTLDQELKKLTWAGQVAYLKVLLKVEKKKARKAGAEPPLTRVQQEAPRPARGRQSGKGVDNGTEQQQPRRSVTDVHQGHVGEAAQHRPEASAGTPPLSEGGRAARRPALNITHLHRLQTLAAGGDFGVMELSAP